jgi:hypothetical protein
MDLGKIYEKVTDREIRKARGMFYTPSFIVDYILKYTVLEADVVKKPFIKILDPACGAGYFLDKAYDILKQKFESNLEILRQNYGSCIYYKEIHEDSGDSVVQELIGYQYWTKENIHYHILKHCLYGADLDIVAVNLTKAALLNKSFKKVQIDINIVQCDSLLKWEDVNTEKGYREVEEILEGQHLEYSNREKYDISKLIFNLKSFWDNEFDYIVGNPPYVVLLQSETKKLYWDYIISRYNSIGYKKNIFYLLIERSLEKLKIGGKHGFIVPDRYFLANSYIKSRKKLFSHSKLISITQFSNKVFQDAIVNTVVYICENSRCGHKHSIDIKLNYKNEDNCEFSHINQNDIVKEKNCIINITTKPEYIDIVEKIKDNSKLLGSICAIHVGMMVKNKKETLKNCYNNGDNKIVTGRDLGEYTIDNEERYCCLKDIKIFGGTKNINKHLTTPKVFLRKTGDKIVASLDNKGIIAEQSVYLVIPINSKDIYNILGQVQSRLCDFYFKEFLITNANVYPYIQHYDVERLPINFKVITDEYFKRLVVKIIDLKNKIKDITFNSLIEGSNYDDILDRYRKIKNNQLNLKSELIECINESNYILYRSYDLTEEEIRLLESRTDNNKKQDEYIYHDLVSEIYRAFIRECIVLLEEKGRYLSVKEINVVLKERLKNYDDFVKIINDFTENVNNSMTLEDILILRSCEWGKYVRNKEKQDYVSEKKLIRYNNKYYGLSSWGGEIHNIWFKDNKNTKDQ